MKRLPCGLALVLLLLVATLFSGCAHVGTEEGAEFIIATSEAFSRFKGEYENTSCIQRLSATLGFKGFGRCFKI